MMRNFVPDDSNVDVNDSIDDCDECQSEFDDSDEQDEDEDKYHSNVLYPGSIVEYRPINSKHSDQRATIVTIVDIKNSKKTRP